MRSRLLVPMQRRQIDGVNAKPRRFLLVALCLGACMTGASDASRANRRKPSRRMGKPRRFALAVWMRNPPFAGAVAKDAEASP